jgi:hypothetical protein
MTASQLPVTEAQPEQTISGKIPVPLLARKKRGKKSEKYWCSTHFNF